MQDTNLPSLFCGTAQDSKDSSNSRKDQKWISASYFGSEGRGSDSHCRGHAQI
ncbi:hypothetical protein YC2023_104218 [Brassica napus]